MKPYFIQFVNRETTQILLNIIGDYSGSFCDQSELDHYRLRFFVTSRQHLGKIYCETIFLNIISKRRYLKTMWWQGHIPKDAMSIALRLECVREKLDMLRICSKGIKKQIVECYQPSDYVLRRTP
jgi:hypothetical protein